MPKSIKTVAKSYTYNTNYTLSAKRLESIIKVIESSRDNLNRSNVAHIVIWVDSVDFDKSVINRTLDKALRKELDTGYGYFLALEKSRGDGYHIHIMLTFSTGKHLPITVLKKAVDSLYSLDSVHKAMAIPRKYAIECDGYTKWTDRIDGSKNYAVSIGIGNYGSKSAMAIGGTMRINDNIFSSASFAIADHDSSSSSLGVSFAW